MVLLGFFEGADPAGDKPFLFLLLYFSVYNFYLALFFLTSFSLLRFSVFYKFVSRKLVVDCWNILMMAASKSLSDHSSIWSSSVLVLVAFSYSHHDFLGSRYDGFLLHPGLVAVIVRRCRVLFISFILAGSAHRSWQEVELRYDPRMNISNSNSVFGAFVELFWSAFCIWYCWGSQWPIVGLPEGAEAFPRPAGRWH